MKGIGEAPNADDSDAATLQITVEETGRYKYVNVTATTVQYGASEWKETAKGSGYVDTMDDIIVVAKKNGSCGFVMIPEDPGKPYSIEEYLSYLESAKKK